MVIRSKFRGRNRRDNNIKIDSIVLVGPRTYEVVAKNKKQKVDLLEVYNNEEVDELIKKKQLKDCILPSDKINSNENNVPFEFTDDEDDEDTNTLINEKISKTNQENTTKEEKDKPDEPDFDWDDI